MRSGEGNAATPRRRDAGASGREGVPVSRGARLLGGAAVPALGAGCGVFAWHTAVAVDWRAWEPGDAIAVAVAIAGAVAAARFLLDVAVATLAQLAGRAAPARTGLAARAVAAALAATLLGAGTAQAADEPPSAGWLPVEAAPTPARTAEAAPAAPVPVAATPAGTTHDGGGSVHVVVRGESLWSITAAALGPRADASQIASAWPDLYAHNRATVGPDPGLIIPGQRLTIPDSLTGAAR